tara:strand:- start:528 stop:908 length:381 start_codon:yes stop_codon:yes gene_type:complete
MTKSASIITAKNMIAHAQHVLANQTASSYGQTMATNNTNAIIGRLGQAQRQAAEYSYDPNVEPSWKIPLSELITLWRAKFGDVWVDVSDLEEVFWYRASMRLSQNKLFEEGDTRDSTPWVRLKEDV